MITEEEVMKHLKDIKEVLDKNSIPFWLEDGTMLGAVRDGRMIPWDHDIDLGSFVTSFKDDKVKRNLAKQFNQKEFSVYFFPYSVSLHRDNFHTDIILLISAPNGRNFVINRFLSQNKVSHLLVKLHKLSKASFYGGPIIKSEAGTRDLLKTNFFFLMHSLPKIFRVGLYKTAKYLLSNYEVTKYYSLEVPAKHFKSLKTVKYGGHIVNIPDFPEEYLEKKYGDWRTPPKDPSKWKWYEVGEWPKIEKFLDRKKSSTYQI